MSFFDPEVFVPPELRVCVGTVVGVACAVFLCFYFCGWCLDIFGLPLVA